MFSFTTPLHKGYEMTVGHSSTITEAAKMLRTNDAVIIHPPPGQPMLILFCNEDACAKAVSKLGGRTCRHEGYPGLECKGMNLVKRLKKIAL